MKQERTSTVIVQLRYVVSGNRTAAEKVLFNTFHSGQGKIERISDDSFEARYPVVEVNPDSCEGYKNYITFSLSVWLKNDHKIYDRCRKMAADYVRLSRETLELNDTTPELVMADWLQQFVETRLQMDWREDTANTDVDRMFVQMAQAALGQVDWRELADEWIQTVQEG